MARYDYKCTKCEKVFEVEHPMGEHPEITCPDCGSPATKVFSATGIEFKGSGFYNTDQRDSKKALPASGSKALPEKSSGSSGAGVASSSGTSSDSGSAGNASSTSANAGSSTSANASTSNG